MSHRGGKKPGRREEPSTSKRPSAVEDADAWKKAKPVWSFLHVDNRDPSCKWSWAHCTTPDLCRLLDVLRECERKTWFEIFNEQVHKKNRTLRRNGAVAVGDVCVDAQKRFAELPGLDEYEEIVKVRITSAGRVWGVRNENVLHIIWWDPDHTVLPSRDPADN